MFYRSRVILSVVGIIVFFVSLRVYTYFFDTSTPELTITGIMDTGFYAGDIQCHVEGSDAYKVANISVSLDGKALVNNFKINKKSFNHEFPIASKALVNGKHSLMIEACDGSYRKNKTIKELTFFIDNIPLQAAFVKSSTDYKIFQGRVLHVQFQVNKEIKHAQIKALSRTYACIAEAPNSLIYECFVPIACEESPNEYVFLIEITDQVGNTMTLDNKFHVVMYPFKKQNLTLKAEKIKHENESGLSAQAFEATMAELSAKSPNRKLWHGVFYTPIDIRSVSTDFGTVRTTQERGKYSHNALDVLGVPRSVVWATQDGVVVLKERYAHAGNTVIIDHGCGVLSLFFHLEDFANLNVGDPIKKGSPVGTLGMTGYASGYHLHWEVRVRNIPVDPMQWTKHDF